MSTRLTLHFLFSFYAISLPSPLRSSKTPHFGKSPTNLPQISHKSPTNLPQLGDEIACLEIELAAEMRKRDAELSDADEQLALCQQELVALRSLRETLLAFARRAGGARAEAARAATEGAEKRIKAHRAKLEASTEAVSEQRRRLADKDKHAMEVRDNLEARRALAAEAEVRARGKEVERELGALPYAERSADALAREIGKLRAAAAKKDIEVSDSASPRFQTHQSSPPPLQMAASPIPSQIKSLPPPSPPPPPTHPTRPPLPDGRDAWE